MIEVEEAGRREHLSLWQALREVIHSGVQFSKPHFVDWVVGNVNPCEDNTQELGNSDNRWASIDASTVTTTTVDATFVSATSQLETDLAVTINETASTPGTPSVSAACRLYMKADKLVVMYDDAGTVRYKYLTLTGAGATWTDTTTAP